MTPTLAYKISALQAEHAHAARRLEEEVAAVEQASRQVRATVKAQEFLQSVAATLQQQAHQRIARIVSRCLRAVYSSEAYEFVIKFLKRRGKTEAELVFTRDGHEYSPLASTSGGQASVAAFALRLAKLILSHPQRRRFLALDEPFVALDRERMPAMREMLLELASELGVQFLIATHNPALQAGKVIRLEKQK